ncbi:MAG TPA: cytidine deaminase [Actinomycetota bacterium]|nr:cytidine deaminase [Actinomycetota bacterium]
MTERVDWDELRAEASEAAGRAYAPYSHTPMGAAALLDDGSILTGCSVENASFGLSLCAECGLVSALYDSGGGRFVGITLVDLDGNLLTPCGRCRQLLFEAGGPELLVDSADGPRRLDQLLPDGFSADQLAETTGI